VGCHYPIHVDSGRLGRKMCHGIGLTTGEGEEGLGSEGGNWMRRTVMRGGIYEAGGRFRITSQHIWDNKRQSKRQFQPSESTVNLFAVVLFVERIYRVDLELIHSYTQRGGRTWTE
jgi:hypothetical protein